MEAKKTGRPRKPEKDRLRAMCVRVHPRVLEAFKALQKTWGSKSRPEVLSRAIDIAMLDATRGGQVDKAVAAKRAIESLSERGE